MPFNIWCLGCNNHIGMGVRYNAEKKKIGMYYTTPLYEFRMKCHLCDNYFVIRTDPEVIMVYHFGVFVFRVLIDWRLSPSLLPFYSQGVEFVKVG